MAEYIDRKKTINDFSTEGALFTYGQDVCKAIVSRIKIQPASDVVEVVHGKWIGRPLCGYSNCRCSVCGSWFEIYANLKGAVTHKYCPNCGAKMDSKA